MSATEEVRARSRVKVGGAAETDLLVTSAPAGRDFWTSTLRTKLSTNNKELRRKLRDLVIRVSESTGVVLFDAVEAGVPTNVVKIIAGATGESATAIMNLAGVSQTTFIRKEAAKEPLPDAAGHRIMGYLRVVATLRRLLDESGDPGQMKDFDLEGWVAQWMHEELPELGGKTPAEMLRNPEGQRVVEQVLERMRGGLVA
ncbi:antitoxin Xre/MbcA/ParS toxin-binding domain-containing protein [Undibacterium arcticum]|uniref:Antitoxin Xre/MbcA/ParS toxin-binding domain-containing protein n=1 Tax=Undibacterium arcticum TaxID=1762892 RepID=A0ABV7F6R9_9BURK